MISGAPLFRERCHLGFQVARRSRRRDGVQLGKCGFPVVAMLAAISRSTLQPYS
jgi:hypothetical protein